MSRKIALFGAFDRFNYGDVLFPIITKELFDRSAFDATFTCCTLTTSDLTALGAPPSLTLEEFIRGCDSNDDVSAVVVGGEVLSQDWFGAMYSSQDDARADILSRLQSGFGSTLAESFARLAISNGRTFPWLLDRREIPVPIRLAYNSVGGWPLRRQSFETKKAVADVLARARFVSVRDRETESILKEINPAMTLALAPDIASLTSDVLRISHLESAVSPMIRAKLQSQPYMCFSANPHFLAANMKQISKQLTLIASQRGLRIVLLPIGRCSGWRDTEALSSLLKELDGETVLFSETTTINDVTFALANSRLFVGTSLHGHVVSVSYGIPTVGLATDDPKLQNYLDSWGLPEHDRCVGSDSLPAAAESAISVSAERLNAHGSALARLAWSNFQLLARALSQSTSGNQ